MLPKEKSQSVRKRTRLMRAQSNYFQDLRLGWCAIVEKHWMRGWWETNSSRRFIWNSLTDSTLQSEQTLGTILFTSLVFFVAVHWVCVYSQSPAQLYLSSENKPFWKKKPHSTQRHAHIQLRLWGTLRNTMYSFTFELCVSISSSLGQNKLIITGERALPLAGRCREWLRKM